MADTTDDHNMKMFKIAKSEILRKLQKEGYLNKDQVEDIDIRWQFVLYKPKWYENWANLRKFKKEDMGDTHVKLVDFVTKDDALELIVNNEE